MKQILNKRLQTISAFIKDGDCVLDVGCDHCLLGIYLVLNKNVKVIGSDINSGPLEKAHENLVKYHLVRKIELRLGDGLNTITDDINTLVISGMGGLSIINILKDIKKYPHVKKIIVSPNNDFSLTREEISKLGFYIYKETMVLERNKYYLISEYRKGTKKTDNYFGKLNLENEIVRKYYKHVYDSNLRILSKLGLKDRTKKKELTKENNKIKKESLNK